MTQWHMKSGTKVSGGTRTTFRRSDKRLAWKGGNPMHTTIPQGEDDEAEIVTAKGMGNTSKTKLKIVRFVLATDQQAKKARKLEITSVVENHADTQFARRNIITKGAVVETEDGEGKTYVKIMSRPGQSGALSGIVLKDYHREQEERAREKKESKKAKKSVKTHKKAKTEKPKTS